MSQFLSSFSFDFFTYVEKVCRCTVSSQEGNFIQNTVLLKKNYFWHGGEGGLALFWCKPPFGVIIYEQPLIIHLCINLHTTLRESRKAAPRTSFLYLNISLLLLSLLILSLLSIWLLSQFEFFFLVLSQFGFFVLSHFEILSFVTFLLIRFCHNLKFFLFSHNLSFWDLSYFEFFCFVTIWVFEFCKKKIVLFLSQFEFLGLITNWVLSQFGFLSFPTVWIF